MYSKARVIDFEKGPTQYGYAVSGHANVVNIADFLIGAVTSTAIETRRPTSLTNAALLQAVIAAVNYVICEKENRQYRRLSFAFQAQVGNQLKRSGIDLPKPLGEYLSDYPQIFRIGTHPYTHAATVSIR